MNFLEARRIVDGFTGGEALSVLAAMSGTGEPLELYLRAAAAQRGIAATVHFLPFNTLQQTLLAPPSGTSREVFLLLPWDLAPELDWRSGVPAERLDSAVVLDRADTVLARLRNRTGASLLYLPAPIPPALADAASIAGLNAALQGRALAAGAGLLAAEDFSLASYFASGLPVAAKSMGTVAVRMIERLLAPRPEPAKLLVTDLDNTLWRGIIAEDGVAGIKWGAEGTGYRHFVYQTLLRRLRGEGILVAAVSRNSPDVALAPIKAGTMTLREEDFVTVIASYHAKSAQIQELARQLNLGLDAVVFVDDNEIELQEVSQALPEVTCLAFPRQDEGLPALLAALTERFGRRDLTTEDRGRTDLYRRRLESMVPQEVEGADLHGFLQELKMRLVLHDRSTGDNARAVQLINKTNQFNANGRRVTEEEVRAILATGGRLLGATLEDRTGSHGEILSMLINPDREVVSFVLSCRVFQRRVETAFCTWLADQPSPPVRMAFAPTERNEPFQTFLRDPAFGPAVEGTVTFDAAAYAAAHAPDLALFDVVTPVPA